MRTFPLTWQDKSPCGEQAFSGTWPGSLFSLCPSITQGVGYTLTTSLPVRVPDPGPFLSTEKAKTAAQGILDSFVAGIAPTINTTPAADTLRQVLQFLAPSPPGNDHPQPSDATHRNLTTALNSNGTPYRETRDGGGWYVVIDPLESHLMHVHNPLGLDYGFDWDIIDSDPKQILTGTWRLGPIEAADRVRSLLSALHR